MALNRAKQMDLNVKSPIDGQVITWDLNNRLMHRPVQRGQELLRVADPSGPWQLELQMPENHMGFVVETQQKRFRQARDTLRGWMLEDAKNVKPREGEDAANTGNRRREHAGRDTGRTVARQNSRCVFEAVPRPSSNPFATRPPMPKSAEKLDAVLQAKTYDKAQDQTESGDSRVAGAKAAGAAEASGDARAEGPEAAGPLKLPESQTEGSEAPRAAENVGDTRPEATRAAENVGDARPEAAGAAEAAGIAEQKDQKPPEPPKTPETPDLFTRLQAVPRDNAPDDRIVRYPISWPPTRRDPPRARRRFTAAPRFAAKKATRC